MSSKSTETTKALSNKKQQQKREELQEQKYVLRSRSPNPPKQVTTKSPKRFYPLDEEAVSEYGVTTIKNADGKGLGVIAEKDIPAGVDVLTYFGKSTRKILEDDVDKMYAAKIDEQTSLVGKRNSCHAVSINHSCEPNCRLVRTEGTSHSRSLDTFIIESLGVKKGQEVTIDYGEYFHSIVKKCMCKKCGGKDYRESCQMINLPGRKQPSFIVNVELTEQDKTKYACKNVRKVIL